MTDTISMQEPFTTFQPDSSIPGYRSGWVDRMVANAPKDPALRAGYVSALKCLEAESLPVAYCRSESTANMQFAISTVRHRIESAP
jgi:hypothetical protein